MIQAQPVTTEIVCDACGAVHPIRGDIAAAQAALDEQVASGRWERSADGKVRCTLCLALSGKWGGASRAGAQRFRAARGRGQ